MIGALLLRLTAPMPARAIHIGDRPYIERYFVGRWLGCTVYLHRYLGSDGDRQVHDHPWRWAVGIPLVGGYLEERVTGLDPRHGWLAVNRPVRRFRPNLIRATTFHRIVSVEPGTWTLFVHGSRFKGWGFLRLCRWGRDVGMPVDARQHRDVTVEYHQPFDFDATRDWECRAVTGRELRAAEGTDHEERRHG